MRTFGSLVCLMSALAAIPTHAADEQAGAVAVGPPSLDDSHVEVGHVEIGVEHGERRPVIDGVGWVIGVPSKLLLLDKRADNHDVSPETVEQAYEYLEQHEVDGVLVRVNQYDPLGEWRRLASNKRVGLGWRATVGAAYTLGYSILPGRLFGNDWYNPFTDTVHLYSDVPALALEQAAQAHDVRDRSHPGFYSATKMLPLVGMVHEARAKEAVFDHIDKTGDATEQAEARRVLHPQLGREIGGHAALFVPQGEAILSLGGAAVGHVVGRYQASRIETQAEGEVTTTSDESADAKPPTDSCETGVPCGADVIPPVRE